MLKVYLKLRSKTNVNGYKVGEECVIYNNVFSESGIARLPLDSNWEVIEMKILEYKPIEPEIK